MYARDQQVWLVVGICERSRAPCKPGQARSVPTADRLALALPARLASLPHHERLKRSLDPVPSPHCDFC